MSNGVSGLEALARERDHILLAEVAGLLHDWQKCIDMAVASQWSRNPNIDSTKTQTWQQQGPALGPRISSFSQRLEELQLTIAALPTCDLKTLIEIGREPGRAARHNNPAVQLLTQVATEGGSRRYRPGQIGQP